MGIGSDTYAAAAISSHQELEGHLVPNYHLKFVPYNWYIEKIKSPQRNLQILAAREFMKRHVIFLANNHRQYNEFFHSF
jgi:hypothetical protein